MIWGWGADPESPIDKERLLQTHLETKQEGTWAKTGMLAMVRRVTNCGGRGGAGGGGGGGGVWEQKTKACGLFIEHDPYSTGQDSVICLLASTLWVTLWPRYLSHHGFWLQGPRDSCPSCLEPKLLWPHGDGLQISRKPPDKRREDLPSLSPAILFWSECKKSLESIKPCPRQYILNPPGPPGEQGQGSAKVQHQPVCWELREKLQQVSALTHFLPDTFGRIQCQMTG